MRKVISLLLTIAMVLSLLVVASATSTENASVYLKTKKVENGNNTVTYTFTLDTGDSDGVGALSFYVDTKGLTYKNKVYNDRGTELDKVFKPSTVGTTGVKDGTYGFYEKTGRFYAYGGDSTATPPRVLKGSVVLVAVTYTIDDAGYSLTVKTGKDEGFKACLSGKQAALETERYNCQVEPIEESGSKGVTVGGTVTSFGGETDTVTVELWKAGAANAAYQTTVTGNSAAYSIAKVESGSYTMKVMKKNHVTREYAVEVADENVAQDAKICLPGDVSGDGVVSTTDINILRLNILARRAFDDYTFALADVNHDNAISVTDINFIRLSILGRKDLT